MKPLEYFSIKNLRGIESKIDAPDAGRGGFLRSEGVLAAPWWGLSNGPTWGQAFPPASGTLGAAINAAMAAVPLDATKVHFATVTSGDTVFLVAWDRSLQMCVGFFHVGGSINPPVWTVAPTIVVNTTAVWDGYTAGLRWYGRWFGNALWLGNGTDANLVWKSSTLVVLGPATVPAVDPYDVNQAEIPPCFAFARDIKTNVGFAAGNASTPLRVWIVEPPTIDYPYNEGLKSLDSSYTDIALPEGTTITALQETDNGIVVHTTRGAILLDNVDGVQTGWRSAQKLIAPVNTAAINPSCASNEQGNSLFIGQNYELYRKEGAELVTTKSTSFWNRYALRAAAPTVGQTPLLLHDFRGGRAWLGLPVLEDGTTGWWVWDERNDAITGPLRCPDLVAATVLRYATTAGCLAVGMTRGGVLLYADLNVVDEPVLPEPFASLSADYIPAVTEPVAANSPGISYVGMANVNGPGGWTPSWKLTREASSLFFAQPWAETWGATGAPPTQWFKNATLGVVEFLEEDFGDPVHRRNYLEVRVQWRRNQIAYCGVFCEADGMRDGRWLGLSYWGTEQMAQINLLGVRLRIRLVCVFFNNSRALLPDISVGYLTSTAR